MFKWFTNDKVKKILYFLWCFLMVITLFLGRIDLSIFAALMLILTELEKLNDDKNESKS